MTNPPKPLSFSVQRLNHEDRNGSYGERIWMIGLPDGREAHLNADEIQVLPDGTLRCHGIFRHPNRSIEDEESHTLLLLPPGAWTHAYAASFLDGCPVAIKHLAAP